MEAMNSPQQPNSELALFESYLRRSSRRRLARVVKQFYTHVWGVALRLSGNEDDAADITQETFLSLLLHPPAPGAVTSPRGYLAFRVITLARRMERARQRRRQRETRAAKQILQSSAAQSTDVDSVREAIRNLPERLRTVVELRYLGQFRNREIAEILGISERSVEEHLRHGREKLRVHLGRALASSLFLPGGGFAMQSHAPGELLGNLLRVVRLGRALSPAVATATAGGLAMKKIVTAVAVALVIAVVATWKFLPEEPAEERRQAPAVEELQATALPAPRAVEPETPSAETVEEIGSAELPAASVEVEERARIAGWVVDATGKGVPAARVAAFLTPLTLRYVTPEPVGETTSDDDGAFLLESVRLGRHPISLTAEKPGFATAQTVPPCGPSRPEVSDVFLILEPDPAAIRGRVVDDGGDPVEGAEVWASTFTDNFGLRRFGMLAAGDGVKTDEEGRFRFDGLRNSTPVDVVARHPLYRADQIRHVIPGGPEILLELTSGSSLSGRVVDTEEKPVAGVEIALREDTPDRWGHRIVREAERSDADGAFSFRALPPRRYRLSVTPPPEYLIPLGQEVDLSGVTEGAAEAITDCVITLETGAWVDGVAKDQESGEPLAGVKLAVHAQGISRTVETDAAGAFRCAVPPGDVAVTPEGDSRLLHVPLDGGELIGRVDEGQPLQGTVWFQPRQQEVDGVRGFPGRPNSPVISGRIVDSGGSPVMALVALSDVPNRSSFVGKQITTHSSLGGQFAFPSMSPFRFPVGIIAADPRRQLMAERVIQDASESTDLVLLLAPYVSPRVEGIVLNEEGEPIPEAGVLITRSGRDTDGAALCARAGPDGRFVLDRLLPRAYYGFTPVVGVRQGPTTHKPVRNGETLSLELVMPQTSARLSGTVRDRQDRPLVGLRVYYDFRDDFVIDEEFAVTDEEGKFEATVLPGRYHVTIDERGFRGWSSVETADKPIDILLVRSRTVIFRAEDPAGYPITFLSLSGKTIRGKSSLSDESGAYEVEIPETETETEFTLTPRKHRERKIELRWPTEGDLDLGTLRFEQPADS